MRAYLRAHWLFLILLIFLSGFYFGGLNIVPFHPDESTQLYMSSDFEKLFQKPISMAWDPEKEETPQQRYRKLDAPITKYLLGLGRFIKELRPLTADWNWSKSWEENKRTGALPSSGLLHTGRTSITLLIPLSLTLIYTIGNKLGGRLTGFSSMVFLGLHPLILLHARRAMAEGALVFGILFFLWGVIYARKYPWLTVIAFAIAFNAKQSAGALLPLGLLAVNFPFQNKNTQDIKTISFNIIQFVGTFTLITFLLNPLLWSSPLKASQAAWQARQQLLSEQVYLQELLLPEQVLHSPSQRSIVILAHLFVAPPQFAEVGNYVNHTTEAEIAYLNTPGHVLLRGLVSGGMLLFITLFGLTIANIRGKKMMPSQNRIRVLVLLGTLFQLIGMISAIPLPFQRYSIPLVPFACLWAGYGTHRIYEDIKNASNILN